MLKTHAVPRLFFTKTPGLLLLVILIFYLLSQNAFAYTLGECDPVVGEIAGYSIQGHEDDPADHIISDRVSYLPPESADFEYFQPSPVPKNDNSQLAWDGTIISSYGTVSPGLSRYSIPSTLSGALIKIQDSSIVPYSNWSMVVGDKASGVHIESKISDRVIVGTTHSIAKLDESTKSVIIDEVGVKADISDRLRFLGEFAHSFAQSCMFNEEGAKPDTAMRLETELAILNLPSITARFKTGFEVIGPNFISANNDMKSDTKNIYSEIFFDISKFASGKFGTKTLSTGVLKATTDAVKKWVRNFRLDITPFESRKSFVWSIFGETATSEQLSGIAYTEEHMFGAEIADRLAHLEWRAGCRSGERYLRDGQNLQRGNAYIFNADIMKRIELLRIGVFVPYGGLEYEMIRDAYSRSFTGSGTSLITGGVRVIVNGITEFRCGFKAPSSRWHSASTDNRDKLDFELWNYFSREKDGKFSFSYAVVESDTDSDPINRYDNSFQIKISNRF